MTLKIHDGAKALDLTWPLGQALNTPRDTPVPQEHGAPGRARMLLTWFLPAGDTSAWLESSERRRGLSQDTTGCSWHSCSPHGGDTRQSWGGCGQSQEPEGSSPSSSRVPRTKSSVAC